MTVPLTLLAGHCCVGRSRMAGDWSGDWTRRDLGLRRLPIPAEVISLAVRWYLRDGLSYRDVEELLAERGIAVDHVTIYRWVQRCTPEFIEAARPCRHAPGDRWFADETYGKVAGAWTYLYRAVDQHGQVIESCCRAGVTWRLPGGSSPGRCAPARSRPKSPQITPPSTRGCSMS
jgi:DDE superfamily endonuclease